MMGSKVTVLIPFYNPGSYILEALDSVFLQTYKDWQIILIDDASTDNTVTIIEDYLKDPRVRLVRHSQNMGQSKSMNTGLKQVETPFLIQLDADDWFYPHTLEILIKETETNPEEIAVFSGNINLLFEFSKNEAIRKRNRNIQLLKKQERLRTKAQTIVKGRSFQNRYDFLMANCSVWPRFYLTSALQSVGGWPVDDPYEGRYAEDLSVLLRLIENYRFHWVDEVLMNHRRHNYNQSNMEKIYGEVIEWRVRDTLKRWGDDFEPIFKTTRKGWKIVTQLKAKK